jgi:hypothetical protein
MRATPTNPYSFYNANGDENRDAEGNLRWKSIVDLLTAVIADVDQPAEERDRAAAVLKFYAAKEQEKLVTGETNPAVAGMFARMGAHSLWEWPDKWVIETVTGEDGITRQNVNRRQQQSETPAPTPAPVPAFAPAVPLPVIAPSAEEQKAIRELSFDERFSPGAVAARVAAIEKEAAVIRRMREQTE